MVFSRILLPLDGSAHAEHGLSHAGRIGRTFGGKVTLLQVLNGGHANGRTGSDSIDWRLRRAEAERYLDTLSGDPRLEGVTVARVLTEGRPADQIVDHIRRHDINLVIMSSWGAGGESDFPYGGTAHKVLASTGISYLVTNVGIPGEQPDRYRRILVPLDGSQKAELAAHVAVALDVDRKADVILCHVINEPSMPRRRPLSDKESGLRDRLIECNRRVAAGYLEELRDQFGADHRVEVRLEVSSDPVRCIADICGQIDADLVIMTARRGRELDGWSRVSITQSVLAAVRVPVLAIQDGIHLPGDRTAPSE
jgi:nucleotide-binding universal stress UspA family protein